MVSPDSRIQEWTDHHARLEKAVTGGKHKGLKYNVVYQLLNAADYGAPQRRPFASVA